MDKTFLVDQLVERLRESAAVARKAGQAAEDEARNGATPAEKRENARVAMEFAGLARGQKERAARAAGELSTLETFRPPRLSAGGSVAMGAIVEVEDGAQGRTFFSRRWARASSSMGRAATGFCPWSRQSLRSGAQSWGAGSATSSR